MPDVPFDPWRAQLYTPAELYDGLDEGYDHTLDARVYAWSRRAATGHDLRRMLAKSLHDRSIDDALDELTHGRRIVGVMGGHALARDEAAYADAARFAHRLADAGLTVATGGGPGAMEAANLGARLAGADAKVLDEVLTTIAAQPAFHENITAWAEVALAAVAGLDDSGRSLGIPTWHYGHEPPNPFSSAVAKYFRNAIREDVLLEVSPRRDRVPPRRRRHGAGDLPGRVHQLLRRGGRGQDDGVRGRGVLDPHAARLAASRGPRRRTTVRRRAPISSTTWTQALGLLVEE